LLFSRLGMGPGSLVPSSTVEPSEALAAIAIGNSSYARIPALFPATKGSNWETQMPPLLYLFLFVSQFLSPGECVFVCVCGCVFVYVHVHICV
jgi:hypothetical protein